MHTAVVQLLSHVGLFVTSWTAAHKASLSFTISQSFLELMSIELLMPSINLTIYCPLFLMPSIFPSIRVFSNELALCIRWPKYWSFSFRISPSNEYSGLISLVFSGLISLLQGSLENLFQQHNLKASTVRHIAFCMVQFSHLYMTARKTWFWLDISLSPKWCLCF